MCHGGTCDVVLFEGVTVDLMLIGAVFLQPLAHVLLGPQGDRFGQFHIAGLSGINHVRRVIIWRRFRMLFTLQYNPRGEVSALSLFVLETFNMGAIEKGGMLIFKLRAAI